MVYVDPLAAYGWVMRGRKVKSCHMFADNPGELHTLAQGLGLKRSRFQNKKALPHYDLVPSRRLEAIKRGAVAVELSVTARHMQRNRDNMLNYGG